MTIPNDPADALKWAMDHSNQAWWIIGAIGAGIAWTSKRLRDWNRRNTLAVGPSQRKPAGMNWGPGAPAPPPAAPAPAVSQAAATAAGPPQASYTAAPSYAASGYAAAPAYAAPVAAAPSRAASASRKLHREGAPAQRAVAPVGRSVDVPVAAGATGRWTLAGAFGDPAHARTAIVVAEVLGPPVGLR